MLLYHTNFIVYLSNIVNVKKFREKNLFFLRFKVKSSKLPRKSAWSDSTENVIP